MKYFLGFNKLKYFPLWVIAAYYFPQSFLGLFLEEVPYAIQFLAIACVSCVSYLFFYFCISAKIIAKFVNNPLRMTTNPKSLSLWVFGCYFLFITYVALSADVIPLFAMLKGANIDEISANREMFLRTRDGWQIILPYINAIFVMALVPYALASMFYVKFKFRFLFLFLFLFCLALTLEKSVSATALIPIIILNVNSTSNKKSFRWVVALVLCILAVSFMARGGNQMAENTEINQSAAVMPESYQLLKCDDQICYLVNRVLWIPYKTAIDWLKYQDKELNGDATLGRSIGLFASLFGKEKLYLEREVFAFQWGQNETGTGSSNTVYFIDAYVNFAWFGVLLYAAIIALIVKIMVVSDNVPIKCTVYVSLFYMGVNSLPPMLFSGGVIIILLIALLFKQKK